MNALRLPNFTWPQPGTARSLPCPQCGASGSKQVLVSVQWRTEENPDRHNDVLECAGCCAAFYDSLAPPDYSDANIAAEGRAEFYLQQGTGLWQSVGLLARISWPAGARYLEVGCGLGFALDFAIHGLGWRGQAFDPSPIAEIGRTRLGLPITRAYFTGAQPGSIDVALAAEVIEHVPSPSDFLALLGEALASDGVLVLTTPDAAAIRPEISSGALVPLLSPGLHLILQSERSLTRLLQKSGFDHVAVEHDGCSLIAFAARSPLRLSADRKAARALYVGWLARRATSVEADRSLFFAFAGHAYSEAVNDADPATTSPILPALAARLSAEFAIDLDRPLPLSPEIAGASLARLAEQMPLNLPAILIARAMVRLAGGEPRSAVRPLFVAAGEAATALRRALAERMMEDGETEVLGWVAAAEILLCDAEAGAPDVPARLAALPAAPGGGARAERRREIVRRSFTGLVNAGQIPLARTLAAVEGLDQQAIDLLAPGALAVSERDMLFSLGVVELQGRGHPGLARKLFARVRAALAAEETVSDLFWASLRGEVLAIERESGSGAARKLLASEFATLGPAAARAPEDLARRARA